MLAPHYKVNTKYKRGTEDEGAAASSDAEHWSDADAWDAEARDSAVAEDPEGPAVAGKSLDLAEAARPLSAAQAEVADTNQVIQETLAHGAELFEAAGLVGTEPGVRPQALTPAQRGRRCRSLRSTSSPCSHTELNTVRVQ